jgi:CubicO group peptidase (beta-lactamase class C family)
VLAGGAPEKTAWTIARGWADLDRAEPLRPGHRFPAYGVTRLITAAAVPALASLFGPVLPCSGNRGTASRGRHGDYAALGQLIADVTGSDYAEAAARLVLGPLGMTGSTFPISWPHDDPDAVTGYELEPDGTFVPDLDDVAVIPAAAGLWTTAASASPGSCADASALRRVTASR